MRDALGRTINAILGRVGYSISKVPAPGYVPLDMDPAFRPLYERAHSFSMAGVEAMYAFHRAVAYVASNGIGGDIVECGVWKGGASMLAALTLEAAQDTGRTLYLYDTFAGMTEPTERDRNVATGEGTRGKWMREQRQDRNLWCYSPLEEVQANMRSTGYPSEHLRFVKGRVEDSIPATIPERIAVLRLDTDWYESTYHELKHLFPLLETGGVLIVDDYGQWTGARDAVDQYFGEQGTRILLDRIPAGGCIGVKQR